jgi:hypothetical protein
VGFKTGKLYLTTTPLGMTGVATMGLVKGKTNKLSLDKHLNSE